MTIWRKKIPVWIGSVVDERSQELIRTSNINDKCFKLQFVRIIIFQFIANTRILEISHDYEEKEEKI